MVKKSSKNDAGKESISSTSQRSSLALAEEALRESAEKWQAIINNIEDGYYEVDLAGNFTFFNDAICRMTGYSPRELIGMNNRRIMDEYNAKQVFEIFNKVYQTGLATKAFDWELIHKDGTRCFIEVSVSLKRDLNSRPVGFMGIARDITKRKRMEEVLKESEQKHRTIIENIEDGYYEVNLDGDFTFFNDSMVRITGYSREELMGMNYRQILDEYNAKQVYDVFLKVYETGLATKAFDWELIRKDGSMRFIEVSVTLKRDLNSKPIGFMGIARDITNRIKYMETLEAREKELQIKTKHLEDTNTALKVLLQRREEDKFELEETVLNNLNDMVLPHMERLKKIASNKASIECLAALEQNLNAITSPFSRKLSSKYANLTTTEVEVANLVKNGKSTKEIADTLGVSTKTVEVHRLNIRKKMGIANKKASLRTHLLSIQ